MHPDRARHYRWLPRWPVQPQRSLCHGSWTHDRGVCVWRSHSCHHGLCSPGSAPAPATEFSTPMWCGPQRLLWRGILHRTCPTGSILPLHCTRAPLAGYHSSPPHRPWPPAISCFKCFRRMLSSVSFVCFHAKSYLIISP
jgi:hypothetical protein